MTIHQTILDLLGKGIIIDPEAIRLIRSGNYASVLGNINLNEGQILTKDFLLGLSATAQQIQQVEVLRQSKKVIAKDYQSKVNILSDYQENHDTKDTGVFVKHFNDRYSKFRNFFANRLDVQKPVSIGRYAGNSAAVESKVSIIGMVVKKSKSKTGNTLIEVEDPTGQIV